MATMKTTCTSCTQWAKSVGVAIPEFEPREINQATGLCWNVCDLEAEVDAIEQAAYDALAEDY